MVYGYHVILGTYGFWLPNDPRGSWSDFVRSWELRKFGQATKVDTRVSVAGRPNNVAWQAAAKEALLYPPVVLTGEQAQSVAHGFANACTKSGFTLWACAILEEHVHLVLARHRLKAEVAVGLIKGEATKQLKRDGRHLLAKFRNDQGEVPTPWGAKMWKVFLNGDSDIMRSVDYFEGNPEKEGERRQRWSFVAPFQGLETRVPLGRG